MTVRLNKPCFWLAFKIKYNVTVHVRLLIIRGKYIDKYNFNLAL